ncbi:Plant UBX domain-containing protein 4 [Linum perenne]
MEEIHRTDANTNMEIDGGENIALTDSDIIAPVNNSFRDITLSTTDESASLPSEEKFYHRIIFWKNGFTVDDGDLRSMDDPANADFLESIEYYKECPEELWPEDSRAALYVDVVKCKNEDYSPGKKISLAVVPKILRDWTPITAPQLSTNLNIDSSDPMTSTEISGMPVQDLPENHDAAAIFDGVEKPLKPCDMKHLIALWRNGFIVDDGPLSSYEDPANSDFLESIKWNNCPSELIHLDALYGGFEVHWRLVDRSNDDYSGEISSLSLSPHFISSQL